MQKSEIMIVEDDQQLLEVIAEALELEGYRAISCQCVDVALQTLETQVVDIVLSDVNFAEEEPGIDAKSGIDLVKQLRANRNTTPVVLMTAYATVEKAVEALKAGASDYITKPFEASELIKILKRFSPVELDENDQFIAVDQASLQTKRLANQVASTDVSVLICGESGTGKEVLAQYIHEKSSRGEGPFIALNCAAIPENMLEAMLFGYEKGAYTGALNAHAGKFEQAQGGTLLLDEISEMDVGLQAKLLRVLQERQVERLGGKGPINLDVRILATTNRNLKQEVADGRFREDLYYRLNVFPITLRPLRERKADVMPIAESIVNKLASEKHLVFSADAKNKLEQHDWSGNVRELDNVIQRALVFASNEVIEACDIYIEESDTHPISEQATSGQVVTKQEGSLKEQEQELILHALKEGKGSRKFASERLGISPRTLRYKIARLKEKGIDIPSVVGAV